MYISTLYYIQHICIYIYIHMYIRIEREREINNNILAPTASSWPGRPPRRTCCCFLISGAVNSVSKNSSLVVFAMCRNIVYVATLIFMFRRLLGRGGPAAQLQGGPEDLLHLEDSKNTVRGHCLDIPRFEESLNN